MAPNDPHAHHGRHALDAADGGLDPRRASGIGGRRLGVLVAVSLAVTLIVMDGSIVNVALPTLVRELGGASNSELQWIVDAYILVFSTLLLTMGNAADRVGRRAMLIAGAAVFGLTSVGAAYASTPTGLTVWRAAMGVGAAMIFPSTLAILIHAFPERGLRRAAIGVWAACSGLGVAIGPIAGGWILREWQWGAIFLINVPIVLCVIAGVLATVEESREHDRGPLDIAGNILAIAGLLAFVGTLIEAPERGWTSPGVIAGFVVAAAITVFFVRRESTVAHPMLDLELLRAPACATACLAIATAFFGLFGFVFMVTQFLQFVRGHDALEAGVRTLPFAGAIVAGAALAAALGRMLAPRALCALGLMLMAIGFAWAAVDRAETPYAVLAAQMSLLGTGLGLVSASATEVVMASLRSDRLGLASSLNDTARELGGTIGVALMGSVFNAIYRADVRAAFEQSPLPVAAQQAVRQSLGVAMAVAERVGTVAGPEAAARVRGPVIDAFCAGFHASSLVAAGFSAVTAVAVFRFMTAPLPGPAEPDATPCAEVLAAGGARPHRQAVIPPAMSGVEP